MSCPYCGGAVPEGGHCPSCSAPTFADDLASASTAPVPGAPPRTTPLPGPPPRGLGAFRVAPGQRFGDRYTLIEEIGAGGMGQVYKAIDGSLGKTVALKLVRARSGPHEQTSERFRRELTLAQEVTHPNVCRVYDLGEIEGTLFISMEFVEGQSLDDLIQSVGHLSTKQTIALGRQICAGLEAIHSRQIVHRDLKPANIMVDRAGHAILMDFGLAYAHGKERLTGEGAILGTLAYLSPEQAVGLTTDARTDIYALGLVLFEMLTGRRAPGDGGTAPLALRDPGERCPPPSRFTPEVPAEMNQVVLRCLERDPARRYASTADLDAALARLAASLSSGVSARRLRIPAPRGRLASMAAAGVVLLALPGAMGWWATHRPRVGSQHAVVAVLPLETSGEDAKDNLGIGMADTLVAHLAGIPSLTVVSRTASGAAGRAQTRRLAHELGADYVVGGSVVRIDRRMHVTATLLRPDDSVVWGAGFDGTVDDLFSLQGRVAEGVATALAVNLTPADRLRLARSPTTDVTALAAYSRGRALLERPDVPGNVSAAIEAFQQATQSDPRFALAHAGLGNAFWVQYNETHEAAAVTKALESITEAMRLDPDEPAVRFALAVIDRGTGHRPAAIEELRRVLALQPGNDDAYRELGDILFDEGRFDEAIAALRKAVELRPEFWRNHSALGYAYAKTGRPQEAILAYAKVTELQPRNSRGFQMLGFAYQDAGDDVRALENYQKAIAIAPDALAYSNMGSIYYDEGRFPEAARAYEQAIALGGRSPATQRNLGDAYERLNEPAKARQAYLRAVEISRDMLAVNPKDAQTLSRLAVCEAKLGRHADAALHVGEAAGLDGDDTDVLYRKAVVHALAGRAPDALVALRLAVARGFSVSRARADYDLQSLRVRPEFQTLLGRPR